MGKENDTDTQRTASELDNLKTIFITIYCMNKFQLKTPVALLIFNRPETTKLVFEKIREAKPPGLFVVADGPRENSPDDRGKCIAARAVIDSVDWECDVITDYSDENLGCRKRISSGLDRVFDNTEEAIILEDDCLPHPSFFRFCEELLAKYRDDERIMMISGDNFQSGNKPDYHSYYFSRYMHIWGWASWGRAWKNYDVNMKLWPEVRSNDKLFEWLGDKKAAAYWTEIFENTYQNKINTWDYQWAFACWLQKGLSVLPNVNLISNIGFNEEATHTESNSPFANMSVNSMNFPLDHPPSVIRNITADDFTQKTHYDPSILLKVKNKLMNFRGLSK